MASDVAIGGGVLLWAIPLGRAEREAQTALPRLAPEEARRAGSLDPVRGARYAVTRAALRGLLGDRLGLDPRAVPIVYGDRGKPRLADGSLHFSVSHGGDVSVVALCSCAPVGIDVESSLSPSRARGIADRFFHVKEREALAELSPDRLADAVLRCWALKEAAGKALGLDLEELLQRVVLDVRDAVAPALERVVGGPASNRWSVHQMSPAHLRRSISVAVCAPGCRLAGVSLLAGIDSLPGFP